MSVGVWTITQNPKKGMVVDLKGRNQLKKLPCTEVTPVEGK